MRLFPLVAVSLLVSLTFGPAASAGERDEWHAPKTPSIEQLVRERLENDASSLPSFVIGPKARIEAFDLIWIEQVQSTRWIAEVEMLLDFGPPLAAVIGYERRRRGIYELVLEQRDGDLTLTRISPKGRLHPLPGV